MQVFLISHYIVSFNFVPLTKDKKSAGFLCYDAVQGLVRKKLFDLLFDCLMVIKD